MANSGWHGERRRHAEAAKKGLYSRITKKQWKRALKSSKTADWYLDEARYHKYSKKKTKEDLEAIDA